MFVKLFLIMMLINGGFGIMQGYAVALEQYNVAGNLTQTQGIPQFYNDTSPDNTLVQNLTSPRNQSLSGHVGDGGIFDILDDSTETALISPFVFINFLDMGFIFDGFDDIGNAIGVQFPDAAIIMLKAVFGLMFTAFVIYLVTGRNFSSFS